MFIEDDNKVAEALARLLSQYQGSTKLQALISAFVQPIQDAEVALTGMNILRYLPSAQGAQLDLIGRIVGIPRPPGASDATYLNDIYGQIKINTSQGQPEQAIQTFQLFTGATLVLLFEEFPAQVIINSEYLPPDQATANTLFAILDEVLPAGVRPDEIVAFDPTDAFAYAGALPGQGYGTVSDASVGGKYPVLFTEKMDFAYAGDDTSAAGYGTRADPLVGGVYTS